MDYSHGNAKAINVVLKSLQVATAAVVKLVTVNDINYKLPLVFLVVLLDRAQ